jgi:hypothetical protein
MKTRAELKRMTAARLEDDRIRALINDGHALGILPLDDLRTIIATKSEDPAINEVQRTAAAAKFAHDIARAYPRATHIRFANKRTIPADLYSDSHWHDERTATVYAPGFQVLTVIYTTDPTYGQELETLMPSVHDGVHDLGPRPGTGVRAFGHPDDNDRSVYLNVRAAVEWFPAQILRAPKRGLFRR